MKSTRRRNQTARTVFRSQANLTASTRVLLVSTYLMVFRSATLGYVDLSRGPQTENYGGIRPGCWINVLPAGGLVLMPDATDRCTCSYLVKASIGLAPCAALSRTPPATGN